MSPSASIPQKGWRDLLRPGKRWLEEMCFRLSARPRCRRQYQLPSLLNARGLSGLGVEVGVFEGAFSAFLLANWRGRKLISVDPWLAWGDEYVDDCNQDQARMDRFQETARQRLAPFGDRSEIWRLTSREAAAQVHDASLDFVYIDAQHHEAAVTEDLNLWYPKLRSGGLFAGHDFLDGSFSYGVFGVKTAVTQFVEKHHLDLQATREPSSPSWFLFKP